ncbi:hypothetical protein K435DRAFT_844567 [Dendrothele bispora CBS 962.96]|uniref:Uncharacterized protein n=1 Tax=Dendrothele bispora (strain CBS 962.96) TaxID=1314807 RepID=A0A4S8L0X9_DENBC|nr:hypothetical protein K435DRAFT_844567 [Dendrothele bispora CBS 962.96]
MHRTKLSTTAISFLVAYTSLASTTPNHEKGKGKGENYEERHKTRLQTPSLPDSDEAGQTHESIFKGCVDLILLRVTAYTHKIEENAKKESIKKSLRYRIHLNGPNDLKGNHCKHIFFIFTKLLQVPLGPVQSVKFLYFTASIKINRRFSLLHLALHYNSEVLMLMKESSEIKGKSLDKDLYYEPPFGCLSSSCFPWSVDPFSFPPSPTQVVTLSRVGKVFINININIIMEGARFLWIFEEAAILLIENKNSIVQPLQNTIVLERKVKIIQLSRSTGPSIPSYWFYFTF